MSPTKCSTCSSRRRNIWPFFSVKLLFIIYFVLFKFFTFLFVNSEDDEKERGTLALIAELENIDDECDARGISFVRIDSSSEEIEYGIEDVPALVYFESGVPSLYEGNKLPVVQFPFFKCKYMQMMGVFG